MKKNNVLINSNYNTQTIVKKAWGHELWIHNDSEYCGKILHFNKGSKFSMHFHVLKNETWYIANGFLKLTTINVDNAEKHEAFLKKGDIVEVYKGIPHQLEAMEESDVFEISTQHFDDDSYRVGKGDSQC